ncbi:RND superfamily putative drug exporter [Catenuloplanes nepalensis]|uniref:RND superfamily putative drug exporter n=1 Tax=Catenuloplanes nepalensis TaxID=587533 RepID=A0ABT9MJN0_9ACTN|nr:MMPL family transporter [Catenuloplanes nepalensis]MDP9791636.1 RND superfamily putative drug exporter [Catenuloplanes nepalensis]
MRTRSAALIAVAVVLGWLAIAGVTGPYSGRLSEVSTTDSTAFLPAGAEATRAADEAASFTDRGTTPAIVVYERASGLTDADRRRAGEDRAELAALDGVIGPLPDVDDSDDGRALQLIVPVDSALDAGEIVTAIRAAVASPGRDGLAVHVAGPAGLRADLKEVFGSLDLTLLLVTAGVVLVILLVVYRSPVLWIIPLLSAAVSFGLAATAVYFLAKNDIVKLDGQAQGILTVLVFGAGTDYALLLIARYREELGRFDRTADALKAAWRGAAPAIVASAATVIAALLCLLFSGLNSNRALGPISAVGIAATLIVMLTFLPALLLLGGRWAFWPRRPLTGGTVQDSRLWTRVAGAVHRRPRLAWIGTTLALALCMLGLSQVGSTGLGQSDLFTAETDSVNGQEALARHFPGGSGSPTTIFVSQGAAAAATQAVQGVAGVDSVRAVSGPGAPAGPPKVVGGRVQLQATLADEPDSAAAEETVRQIRVAAHAVPDADALVGGYTAVQLDTQDTNERDRNVIIPLVLAVIAVILALLLRSLLAPVLLIATVVLSFGSTLGICALIFRYAFGFPGIDASIPLFAFVFLVALGIDYNIFLMSRVREESIAHGTRAGVLRGLIVTGGVITSAGVVLAATFSALAVVPLVILAELGTAVAVGVLLDTVVVRSLLVPALVHDLGDRVWWPSGLSRRPPEAPGNSPEKDGRLISV